MQNQHFKMDKTKNNSKRGSELIEGLFDFVGVIIRFINTLPKEVVGKYIIMDNLCVEKHCQGSITKKHGELSSAMNWVLG